MFTKETANHTVTIDDVVYDYFPDSNGVIEKGKYCPGFNRWLVTRENGYQFVIEGDDKSSAETRLFFRTNGAMDSRTEKFTIEPLGPNPRTKDWDALWN